MGLATLTANYSSRVGGYFVFVKCDICGAQGKAFISFSNPDSAAVQWENPPCINAVEAWNMRNGRRDSYAED